MATNTESIANSLLDTFSDLLCHQSMILAMNSSFIDPLVQYESQLSIIESSFRKAFAIPTLEVVKTMGTNAEDKEELESVYMSIFNMYEDTLLILVSKDLYKLQILKEMMKWMDEDNLYFQERVMVIISRVLSFASKKARGHTSVDVPCLGVLAAELSLLCCHTDPSIIQQASSGMYYLLSIAKHQNGIHRSFNTYKQHIKEKNHTILSISAEDAFVKIQFNFSIKAKDRFDPYLLYYKFSLNRTSVGQYLMPSLLTDFVWSLLKKLSSRSHVTAFEAAAILKLTLESHAQKVTKVSKIVDDIYQQISNNFSHTMKHALLRVITLLTRTSPKKVIFQLMDYPLPADNTVILMWQAAGYESSVAPDVLSTILLILKGKPGEMEETQMERRRFSLDATNMMPVAASQALCTFLPVGSYKKAVAQFFPQLLMALMLQLFYTSQLRVLPEDRPLFARDALRVLLNCSGLQEVDLALKKKNCWNQFSQVLFHNHGVYLIAKTLSEHNFPQFPETLHYLYKTSVEGPRRSEDSIITIIFLTELLNNFFKDPFPEEFLVLFRDWVNDSNPEVSKLSLQKIASMAPVINEIESACSLITSILEAFLSKEKTVVMRALLTLRRLLGRLDKVTYSSLCTNIASSYCPLMDHSNGGIRSMAIRHFGELLRDMSQYTWMLSHVILGGLVPLILFLEDKEQRVVKACKYTLDICASQLKWSISYLLKDENYNFELVVINICNNLVASNENQITDLISDTLGFMGSSRVYLRRGAVILVGYLAKLGEYFLLKDEMAVMFEVIDKLRWDEDPITRDLAEMTHHILTEIAYKMTSSTIKKNFRRIFRFIYTKRLKPLYNWNMDLTDSDSDTKETKSDKEGFAEDNDDDIAI
ncbi:maestro heat-like repeat-containing protein family member 9 [Dipodomys spectabilis]|uniref:maestro heat-like repeat-containing protein family member 9 n=1 Tax=Dipodomys spectabilis TaxID=105255 RepID=UPI001C53E35D|nr:maestro heat-like repeat-containing protein family member 9 [Dipodomys spectabilis]